MCSISSKCNRIYRQVTDKQKDFLSYQRGDGNVNLGGTVSHEQEFRYFLNVKRGIYQRNNAKAKFL